MSGTSLTSMLVAALGAIATQLPVLLVWVAGAIFAAVRWNADAVLILAAFVGRADSADSARLPAVTPADAG